MKKLEDVGLLVARILMPILFITAGWGKITGYAGTQQYMEAMGVPGFLLPLTILLEFGGGLAVPTTVVLLVAALIGGIWTMHKARSSTLLRHTRQELANDRALLEDDKP